MSTPEPPFTTDSPTDHQPGLWVTSVLCPIYAVLILAIRFALRRSFRTSDIAACIAYLPALISWILLWVALEKGVGKATSVISPSDYVSAANLTYGSIAGALLSIGFATASQCLFVSELASARPQRFTCYYSAAAGVVLSLAALLAVLPGCSPSLYLNHSSGSEAACTNQVGRWIAGAVLLGLASIISPILPPVLFRDLAVPLATKLNVFIALGGGFLNLPLVALLAYYFSVWNGSGTDSLDSVHFLELLQTLLLWTLISTSLPCTRQVALKFTTSRTLLVEEGMTQSLNANGSRHTRSDGTVKPSSRNESWDNMDQPQRQDDNGGQHTITSVSARPATAEATSSASIDSQTQFIRKTVALTIHES